MVRSVLKAVATVAAAAAIAATGQVSAHAADIAVPEAGIAVTGTDASFYATLVPVATEILVPPESGDRQVACTFGVGLGATRTTPKNWVGASRAECTGPAYISIWGKANVEYQYPGGGCCNVLATTGNVRHGYPDSAAESTEPTPCSCPAGAYVRAAGYWDVHYPTSLTITDFHHDGAICTVYNNPDDHYVHCGYGTDYYA